MLRLDLLNFSTTPSLVSNNTTKQPFFFCFGLRGPALLARINLCFPLLNVIQKAHNRCFGVSKSTARFSAASSSPASPTVPCPLRLPHGTPPLPPSRRARVQPLLRFTTLFQRLDRSATTLTTCAPQPDTLTTRVAAAVITGAVTTTAVTTSSADPATLSVARPRLYNSNPSIIC